MLLEGMHLPLTTPFRLDGEIDLAKLEANVDRYSKTPAAGLVVLSRWAEPTLFNDQESRDIIRAVAESADFTKVLTLGIVRESVQGTLEMIGYADRCGYDLALVRVPAFLRGSAENQRLRASMLYFQAVADRSPLPIVLTSGASPATLIPDAFVAELAQHPNVLGLVEEGSSDRIAGLLGAASGARREATVTTVFAPVTRRMLESSAPAEGQLISAVGLADGTSGLSRPLARPVLKTRTRSVGFQVLGGQSSGILDALSAGAVGALPGLAASAPQACYEVVAAFKDGDPALATEKQERLRPLAARIEQQLGIAGIKYGCELTGYSGGRPRLPQLPLTQAERNEIERLMQGIRN